MKITIPRSQTLRFVSQDNYLQDKYNHDNRLLQDEGRNGDEPLVYFQKISTGDQVLIYLITDYPTISCKIYDSLGVLQQTVSLTDVGAGLIDLTAYYGIVDTSILGGIFYCILKFTGVGLPSHTYKSEYFEIADFSTYPLLKWKTNEYSGIFYTNPNIIFGFRIEADITGYVGKLDTESFEAFNSTIVNLKSKIKRIINFETDKIPRYIYEKLIIALGHNHFYINDIEYVSIDSPSDEPIKDSQFYLFKATLAQVEYEVYDFLQESTGGTPTTNQGILSFDGINFASSDGNDLIKIY